MSDFGNVITAMITPFTADGQVNYPVVEKLAAHLVANGSDTVLVCGTTGESPTLTWEEEHDLFQVVQKAVGSKGKVIAGTGSNSTAEAIEATEKAAKLGLDGTLQVVPYYNKPPQEGLYQHFSAIAKAAPDCPVMLYNIPGRTGTRLSPETVAKLAEIDNIVALKEASGSVDITSQMRLVTPPDFSIYSGDDSLTLPMLSVGGKGVVSVASHFVGNSLREMIQAYQNGDPQTAQKRHIQLFPLFKALFCTTNPIPTKTGLKLQGWQVGPLRLPLCDPTPEQEQHIKEVLQKLNLL
ncbi:4-hydroxy-tetrahydrodipicolinate synthase [Spirulina sp. CS-785/01]|uniref:4-hydroxy-tetrahydrodipicolinate synthase n=1 Tax=Spirulina sp. CS-785/01 TaxID=3021716 RepID=UPI00233047B6|nr:4-hydroxy-tetrahydrodipicolinate synthase [Spirulina sp. CS-785/01]MDB9312008.1 4-hydroxy-tetrahydrodipicolinate synthase [Spirulina sp. CS-785/01]